MNVRDPRRDASRRRMTRGLVVAVLCAVAAPVAGWPGRAADCSLHLARSADPGAYYLEIEFDSPIAPDTAVQVRGRALRVQVHQNARVPGAVCRSRISRTVTLPLDADPRHIERYEEKGRVVLVIPRLRPSWP